MQANGGHNGRGATFGDVRPFVVEENREVHHWDIQTEVPILFIVMRHNKGPLYNGRLCIGTSWLALQTTPESERLSSLPEYATSQSDHSYQIFRQRRSRWLQELQQQAVHQHSSALLSLPTTTPPEAKHLKRMVGIKLQDDCSM